MSPAFLFRCGLYNKTLCQEKLDERGQHLMHNIFQVVQQPLNKLFITSQQTFTCSNSTKETIEGKQSKQGNVYWDSFFWLWYNIHLMHNKISHIFFSNYKALLSRRRTNFVRIYTYEFLRKKQFFVTFWECLYEKQLGSLRGISHSPRSCWHVKSLLLSFWVYMMQGGWHTYRDLAFRSKMGWTKTDTNTLAWRDENYTNAYVSI